MSTLIAKCLRENVDNVMQRWEARANQEVAAAREHGSLALRNFLPIFLGEVADALEANDASDGASAQKRKDLSVGKEHGKTRAGSKKYTLDQMIFEYHILRQVIFEVLEDESHSSLSYIDRETIIGAVEQAVNDSATEFSETLRNLQEKVTNTLAHDLRSPLAAATIHAEIIRERSDNAATCLKSATSISEGLERINSMIRDLLDSSRIGAGEGLSLQFKECDLREIASRVVDAFNARLPDARFTLKAASECRGHWSESGLQRVIENLAENAIKHGTDNAPVEISVEQNDGDATLSVHSEGNPIPPDKQAKLFEHLGHISPSKPHDGWGIGLTMVKGMTDAHHGRVSVQSDEENGTTFEIKLPKDFRNLEREESGAASAHS